MWQLAIDNKLKISHEHYQELVVKAKQKLHEAQSRRKRLKVSTQESCCCKKGTKENQPKHDEKPQFVVEMSPKLEDSKPKIEKSKTDDNLEEKPRLSIPRNLSEQNLKAQDKVTSKCCSKSNPNLLDYSDECSMELIQLDIARTFPHLCIFQPGGPYFDVLHELLAAYVCYRPDIGYIQVSLKNIL